MKRLFILLTVIGLLFACAFANAETSETWICSNCHAENTGKFCGYCGAEKPVSNEWTCPDCGTVNNSKFCANCGKAKPSDIDKEQETTNIEPETTDIVEPVTSNEQKSTISDISFSSSEGVTTITWKDSADKGPYEIYYSTDAWGTYQTKYGTENYSQKSASTGYLIPGNTYHITITNGESSESADYTVPKHSFTDFKIGSESKLVINPSSFDIAGNGYYQAFRLTVCYPDLSHNRIYYYLLALKTPRGYSSIIHSYESYELDRRYTRIYEDVGLEDFLDALKLNFGEIMSGEYTFELYFNGALYASAPFRINP